MMARTRFKSLSILCGLLGMCLATVGCQMQASFVRAPIEQHAPHNQEAQANQASAPQGPEQNAGAVPPASSQAAEAVQGGPGITPVAYATADNPDRRKPPAQALPMPAPLEQPKEPAPM